MLSSIGIIGYGFVGKACHAAFTHNTEAFIVDPKYSDITLPELVSYSPPMIFIALPAPTQDGGTVDYSSILQVLQELADIKYYGLVVLKSTIPPQVLDILVEKFFDTDLLRLIYSPEFLREKHWQNDAVNPKQIIMAGSWVSCSELKRYYENHSHVGRVQYVSTDFKSAALAKYAINCFLATKVAFFNQLYQLYSDIHGGPGQPENWTEFCAMMENDTRIGNTHMGVPGPDGNFGYGGTCFPKDMRAMIAFDTEERMTLVREAELSNTQIRLTGIKNST